MNAIQKYAAGVRNKFGAIDDAIAEFKKREAELQAQIEDKGGDYTLKAVQDTTAIRTELAQVTEAIERALERRQQMADELAANMRRDMGAVKTEYHNDVNEANAGRIAEIQDLAKRLRRAVWELHRANRELSNEFDAGLRELYPYIDYHALIGAGGGTIVEPIRAPYFDVSLHDERLLRFVDREARRYNEFETEV